MAGVKSVALIVIVALACRTSFSSPQYPPPPHYAPAPHYKEPARPYSYAYSVDDDYKNLHFSADETSNGNAVKGSYQVALPDGRTQNVDYSADHYKGFVADVSYKGVASYPPPAPYHPLPYKPVYPVPYHPAPYKPAPPPYQ
ncbi:cuticle protein 7-like [Macrobrachium rosenbergii]|uniref:cuticle protein 7-like n=1 Tax=Macrobrachium rosenbergii TaxID=79674 RepID=UPI0034D42C99